MKTSYLLAGIVLVAIVLLFAYQGPAEDTTPESMGEEAAREELTLQSAVFTDRETIPSKYTCDADNINPPFTIANTPPGTKTFVLLMDDPDIPDVVKTSRGIEKFDHWTLYNIPANTKEIPENTADLGISGHNSRGEEGYVGPCPPTEHEPTEHRYIFQLYALDTELSFDSPPTSEEVRSAMKGHILGKAELIGLYDRATN